MTIGVIIPTLNEEQALPQTWAALTSAKFDEIIVADGGSQDRTSEMVESYRLSLPQGVVTVVQCPPGRARQMNTGAAESRSDVLVFLHADTLVPAHAREAIEAVLANPRHVGGRFDVQFERDSGLAWVISRMMNLRSRLSGICTGDQAMFIRRTVFQQLGGFSDIPIMEDIDLSYRLKQVGKIAALRSKVLTSFRRWEQRGPIRTIVQMWALRFLYWIGVSPHQLTRFYDHIR